MKLYQDYRNGFADSFFYLQNNIYHSSVFSSTPLSEDLLPPFSGDIHFKEGENGQRNVLVNIIPTTEEQEVEEYFTIILKDTDPAEVSPTHGNVTITVRKKVRLDF